MKITIRPIEEKEPDDFQDQGVSIQFRFVWWYDDFFKEFGFRQQLPVVPLIETEEKVENGSPF